MKYSIAIAGLAALASAAPAPVVKRADGITDADILQYALTLEHLEDKFYRGGLAKYSEADFVNAGFPAPFYSNLKEISYDEKTHVAYLTAGLKAAGANPVAECVYNFPYDSPSAFVMLSSVLEGVGVSAYLGAAASIANPAYLTAAGSILTVESRHSSYIRASLKESPFPAPFDVPLDFNEVYSLAAQFIVSCPASNGKLPFKAFPPLPVVPSQYTYSPGSSVTFKPKAGLLKSGKKVYAAFFLPGDALYAAGPVFVEAKPTHNGEYKAIVPKGARGQTYIVLQYNNKKVDDSTIVVGPAIIEVCP